MKKQSHTVPRRRQSASPASRHLPLVDILIDAQAGLQELVIASGLRVLEAMLEEDRAAVCGPRYAHQPARHAYRAGHAPSQVVLGGHKVAIRRPRVRRDGMEVPLPTAQAFTDADPLNRRVVDQMLIGVATRQYARSLEPLGANITTRGTSKSAVSRRFVAQTQAQLDAWRATPLDALDLAVLLIDGVQVGGHCIVVALGIDTTGTKHPLGLWEGATENATVCQGLLTNLASRGLRTDRSLLVIVDGAKALETAVTQTFGRAAVVQRGQVHKGRNILEHLPEAQRPWVKAILTRAYTNATEPYRVSRRPHYLGGWGLWDVQVGFLRRCVSARFGWSRSIAPPTRRSGACCSRWRRSLAARPRRYGSGYARHSVTPAIAQG